MQIKQSQLSTVTPAPSPATNPAAIKTHVPVVMHDSPDIYTQRVRDAFGKNEIQACLTLEQACLKRSHEKMPAMTYREMDTALRQGVNLESKFFWDAMFLFDGHLLEGIVGAMNNAWDIRVQWNNCQAFMRDSFESAEPDTKLRANTRRLEILKAMELMKVLPWPEEEAAGVIHSYLTKPEFMSFDTYEKMQAKLATCKSQSSYEYERESFLNVAWANVQKNVEKKIKGT